MKYWREALLVGYLLMALFSFGYIGAEHDRGCKPSSDVDNFQYRICKDNSMLGAMFGAPLWPLYWSWKLQE